MKLWLPKGAKIKGNKFKLPWEGPYKMQKKFNNNMVELSTLNNSDMERVNINKLKKCCHGETPTVIMTIIVNIIIRVKLAQKNNENTKPTNFPWTNSKTKPNEFGPKLSSRNDDTDEIEWLPSDKLKFNEVKPRKCNHNSRKHKYMRTSRTWGQLYPPKFVPTIYVNKNMSRSF